jgi:hypothetical protein
MLKKARENLDKQQASRATRCDHNVHSACARSSSRCDTFLHLQPLPPPSNPYFMIFTNKGQVGAKAGMRATLAALFYTCASVKLSRQIKNPSTRSKVTARSKSLSQNQSDWLPLSLLMRKAGATAFAGSAMC